MALAFSENTDHEGMPVSNNLRLKYDYSFHEITAGHQYQLFKQSLWCLSISSSENKFHKSLDFGYRCQIAMWHRPGKALRHGSFEINNMCLAFGLRLYATCAYLFKYFGERYRWMGVSLRKSSVFFKWLTHLCVGKCDIFEHSMHYSYQMHLLKNSDQVYICLFIIE